MDIETIKYILAVIFAIMFWVFLGAPAFVGLAFGYSPHKYTDAVKGGLCFSGIILAIVAFVFAFAFTMNTLFIL